jgi:hypothetical protein
MNQNYLQKVIALALLSVATISCQDDEDGKSVNQDIDFSYSSSVPP